MRKLNFAILLTFFIGALACTEEKIEVSNPGGVEITDNMLLAPSGGGVFEVEFDILESAFSPTAEAASEASSWLSVDIEGKVLKVTVKPTDTRDERSSVITVYGNGDTRSDLVVYQYGNVLYQDLSVKPVGGSSTNAEDGYGIELSYDGDFTTFFHCKMGAAYNDWPFFLQYEFDGEEEIDYIIYYPRTTDNKWGAFGKFDLLISTHENEELVKIGSYDFEESTLPSKITFDKPIKNPKSIRFEVKNALNSRIACTEMGFYRYSDLRFDHLTIFTDGSCTEIRSGVTKTEIDNIPDLFYRELAYKIQEADYDSEGFRIQTFRPYQDPSIMAAINKTSQYGVDDNATGIYFDGTDEELIVFMGPTNGQKISLVIRDLARGYGNSTSYFLQEGPNLINPSAPGLIYIRNETKDYIPLVLETQSDIQKAESKSVKVHFYTGKVNGYYNSAIHTPEQAQEILSKAKYREIDLVGKYAHVVWPVDHFIVDGTQLSDVIARMDTSVHVMHKVMGLHKYHSSSNPRLFASRMHITVDYAAASPNASDFRTVYTPAGYREVFTTESGFLNRMWVIGHEVGHCNQTRPGFKWAAMTEVSNNIHPLYMQERFGSECKLIQPVSTLQGRNLYQVAIDTIVTARQPHVLDCLSHQHEYKLIPFWQLKLYLVDVLGYEDFYADLHEYYRVTEDPNTSSTTEGLLQLEFVKLVCDLAQLDLRQFFDDWGFLMVVEEKQVNDYSWKSFKITQEMLDEVHAYLDAKGYPEPPHSADLNLYEIDNNNYQNYR